MLTPATLLKERFRQIDFPVNFVQYLEMFFVEHLWVAASASCKNFVILQMLDSFNKSSFIFPLLSLLFCNPSFAILPCNRCVFSTSKCLETNLQQRIFPKNVALIEAVV